MRRERKWPSLTFLEPKRSLTLRRSSKLMNRVVGRSLQQSWSQGFGKYAYKERGPAIITKEHRDKFIREPHDEIRKMRVYEELNYLNYGGKLSTYTRIPVFSCIPCSSFHAHSMRCSMSIPCAVPCAYKDSFVCGQPDGHSWFFQAMPGHARRRQHYLQHSSCWKSLVLRHWSNPSNLILLTSSETRDPAGIVTW